MLRITPESMYSVAGIQCTFMYEIIRSHIFRIDRVTSLFMIAKLSVSTTNCGKHHATTCMSLTSQWEFVKKRSFRRRIVLLRRNRTVDELMHIYTLEYVSTIAMYVCTTTYIQAFLRRFARRLDRILDTAGLKRAQ